MARDPKSGYYDVGGIETLDIIRAKLTDEEYRGYLKGNAIKYLCRLSFKGSPERDAEKVANYAQWLADEMVPGTPTETDSSSQETTFQEPADTREGPEKSISERMEELTQAMHEPPAQPGSSQVSRDTKPEPNDEEPHVMSALNAEAPTCLAGQMSDQMRCDACNLTWDRNDPSPPPCGREDQGFVRLPHQEGAD